MADESELVKEVRAYWAAAQRYDEAVVAERESRQVAERTLEIVEEAELQLKQTVEKLPDECGLLRIDGRYWVLRLTNGRMHVIQQPLLAVADDPPGAGNDDSPDAGEKVEAQL